MIASFRVFSFFKLATKLQAVFAPMDGYNFNIWIFEFNMYTIPAFLMVALSLAACAVTIVFLDANYAGIIEEGSDDGIA